MQVTITEQSLNPQQARGASLGGVSGSGDYYEGTVNGKPFRVLFFLSDSPDWHDSDLDSDEKEAVCAEIFPDDYEQ